MLSKKYLLLAGFAAMCAQPAFAQQSPDMAAPAATPGAAAAGPQWSNRDMTYRGKNYDVLDSSYYPKSRLKQFHKYMDHQEIFPPKPRNMWEVGVGFGQYNVIGDIPSLMFWQKGGYAFHAQVRKSWGYIFSTRIQYIYGIAKNLDTQPTSSFDAPYTNSGFGYTPRYYATNANPATNIYRSTRMESSQLTLDLMFNTHNIRFHRDRTSMSFYGYLGIGAVAYKTRVDALDGSYAPYSFGTIVPDPSASNSTVRKALQGKMDGTYESQAQTSGGSSILDNKTLDFAPSLGLGVQFRLNKMFNIQIEDRYTFVAEDYLDGTKFGTPLGNQVSVSQNKDAINYFSIGLNYNIKLKKKAVEPLYWINPLDHAYSELSYPRHMILPNPVLPDEDNDGITDQFDKCPKTPAGTAVDAHGCPMDTDGDGVPDYKDKQLITPTECQPVDADGVGKCPCPEDCQTKLGNKNNNNACGTIGSGTLAFTGKAISASMKAQLATLASQMQANPTCKAVIIGGGAGSKMKEQRSWEHVNAVIEYMSETNGISRNRFIFQYGKDGDENIVTYRSANENENGPDTVAPPHPELK